MTRDDAEALAVLGDRMTKPILAVMFCAAICWMGVRTVVNISADQFVGIVMMVAGFYFGRVTAPASEPRPAATASAPPGGGTATATVETTKP